MRFFASLRDIVLSPKQAGDPLNYFIYPYVEVDGKEYAPPEISANMVVDLLGPIALTGRPPSLQPCGDEGNDHPAAHGLLVASDEFCDLECSHQSVGQSAAHVRGVGSASRDGASAAPAVRSLSVQGVHQSTRLPCKSYFAPWSSNWWLISWPMTAPIPP